MDTSPQFLPLGALQESWSLLMLPIIIAFGALAGWIGLQKHMIDTTPVFVFACIVGGNFGADIICVPLKLIGRRKQLPVPQK